MFERFSEPTAAFRRTVTIALLALIAIGVAVNVIYNALISSGDPLDFSIFGDPGAAVLQGRWATVFGDPTIQAGPFELAFWGVAKLLGISGSLGWGLFFLVVTIVVAVILTVVAERALRAVTSTWSLQLALVVAALAALSATLLAPVAHGHPAQVAVPIMWLAAGLLARGGRPMLAAAVLGLSAGWEVWGLLGVPVLLLAPRIDFRTVWRSAVGGAAALVLLYLPFVLLGPFRMFGFEWLVSDDTLAHLILPGSETFPWPFRLAQGVLSIGAGAAAVFLVRRGPDALWLAPLALCAVRLLLDPISASYYIAAPSVFIFLGLAHALAQRSWLVLTALILVLNVAIDFPQRTVLVSGAFMLLVAITVGLARRATLKRAALNP